MFNSGVPAASPTARKSTSSSPFVFLLASFLALAPSSVQAAQAVSETFVATASTIRGSDSAFPYTLLSLQAIRPVVASGVLTAVGSSSVSDVAAEWEDDAFNGINGEHYLEFDSGLLADIVATDADGGVLTLAGDLTGLVSVGEEFRIRKHTTLSDVFGSNNEANLGEGSSPSSADNVVVYRSGVPTTYWRANIVGFEGWYDFSNQPSDDVVIYPEQGFYVRRKQAGALTFSSVGVSRAVEYLVPIKSGLNLVGGNLHSNTTLADLQLVAETGFNGGTGPGSSDHLIVYDDAGNATTFWYSEIVGFEGWYSFGNVYSDTHEIPAGSSFFIRARFGAFDWSIPRN